MIFYSYPHSSYGYPSTPFPRITASSRCYCPSKCRVAQVLHLASSEQKVLQSTPCPGLFQVSNHHLRLCTYYINLNSSSVNVTYSSTQTKLNSQYILPVDHRSPFYITIRIHIYINVYIVLRLWKFAPHHKGSQISYAGKFMCR